MHQFLARVTETTTLNGTLKLFDSHFQLVFFLFPWVLKWSSCKIDSISLIPLKFLNFH